MHPQTKPRKTTKRTRGLSKDERKQLDAAIQQYDRIAEAATTVEGLEAAQSEFKDTLSRLGIIPTLAGYRTLNADV